MLPIANSQHPVSEKWGEISTSEESEAQLWARETWGRKGKEGIVEAGA